MVRSLFIVLILLPLSVLAEDYKDIIDLQKVDLSYEGFVSGRSRLLNKDSNLGSKYALNVDLNLVGYVYFKNNIMTLTDQSQFRYIQYNYKLGTRLTEYFDIYYRHRSGHLLDSKFEGDSFPFENSIGIKINIINGNKTKSIW